LIGLLKHILPNFFRLGLIQLLSLALQFLLIPLVVYRAGMIENGKLLTALSISVFFSIIINYGTNQSGPLAIAEAVREPRLPVGVSPIVDVLFLRVLLFLGVALLFFVLNLLGFYFALFLIGTLPILFAEVLNPYIVCIASDRLRILSVLNFLGRLIGWLLIYFCWKDPSTSYLVNAYVGAGLAGIFLFFWMYEIFKGATVFTGGSFAAVLVLLRANLSLAVSNVLVHLQQSFVLYCIGAVASPSVLGIYSIIDKVVWGFRMLLTSFSGAVFASSLRIYAAGHESWRDFRKKINLLLSWGLMLAALALVVAAKPLAVFLGGGAEVQILTLAIRMASLIPLVTGLNLMNVLELILRNEFSRLYRINLFIFLIVVLLSLSLFGIHWILGGILFWMPVILLFLVELITLTVYEKNRHYTR
jgi:O-antigen/teichoic acid export membrane protein